MMKFLKWLLNKFSCKFTCMVNNSNRIDGLIADLANGFADLYPNLTLKDVLKMQSTIRKSLSQRNASPKPSPPASPSL